MGAVTDEATSSGSTTDGRTTAVEIDPSVERIVFATSADSYTGDLGGLAGADSVCQGHAQAAGFSGMFRAWLGTEAVNPAQRFDISFSGSYVLPLVGKPVVAVGWFDLTDTMLSIPIDRDEHGQPVNGHAWTGVRRVRLRRGRLVAEHHLQHL